jgi:predicted N-formylglutamate amidohydrolase
MHSFTPIWQGEPRHVGIGTLKPEKTVLTNKVEAFLEREFQDMFVPDQPYNLSISPHREMDAGHLIAERNNLEYFGLEIRNDLLSTPTQLKIMAEKLIKLAKTLP